MKNLLDVNYEYTAAVAAPAKNFGFNDLRLRGCPPRVDLFFSLYETIHEILLRKVTVSSFSRFQYKLSVDISS